MFYLPYPLPAQQIPRILATRVLKKALGEFDQTIDVTESFQIWYSESINRFDRIILIDSIFELIKKMYENKRLEQDQMHLHSTKH